MLLDPGEPIFVYGPRDVTAWAADVQGNKEQLVLLAGSMLVGDSRCQPSCPQVTLDERSQMRKDGVLREDGENLVLLDDWTFEPKKANGTGMTRAANAVAGNNEAGPRMWKEKHKDLWLREQNLYGECRRITLPTSDSELMLHVPKKDLTTTAEVLAEFVCGVTDAVENDHIRPIERAARM
jgi:hypothetical protein